MKNLTNAILAITIGCGFFIVLLTGCTQDEKNNPPVAEFEITPTSGSIYTVFTFDASACNDAEDETATLQVRWDWDGDGIFDTDYSTNKILNHQYPQMGTYQIIMEVKDTEELSTSIKTSLVIGLGPAPIVITAPISDIMSTSARCGGEVSDIGGSQVTACGVCWDTSPNPTLSDSFTSDSLINGSFNSMIYGLSPETKYYIRAYATNEAGAAYGNDDSVTTLIQSWICGEQITVVHQDGNVAPVDKTVIYSTVTNIPGEETKCWITKNLGADIQAGSLNDASEAAAGWYWQFNIPQGYKHDGSARTPNTPWNSLISESSDWLPSNDPCSIELGDSWRIPTRTEWINTDESGGWTDWNGTWNSLLKIHAGGFLNYPDADLRNRGISGSHWSSTQVSNTNGYHLDFRSINSGVYSNTKAFGISLRCIHD